jgi:hypothetical protein
MPNLSLNPIERNWGLPYELPVFETSATIKDAYEFKVAGSKKDEPFMRPKVPVLPREKFCSNKELLNEIFRRNTKDGKSMG